jgi:hypothetical protein
MGCGNGGKGRNLMLRGDGGGVVLGGEILLFLLGVDGPAVVLGVGLGSRIVLLASATTASPGARIGGHGCSRGFRMSRLLASSFIVGDVAELCHQEYRVIHQDIVGQNGVN